MSWPGVDTAFASVRLLSISSSHVLCTGGEIAPRALVEQLEEHVAALESTRQSLADDKVRPISAAAGVLLPATSPAVLRLPLVPLWTPSSSICDGAHSAVCSKTNLRSRAT